MQKWEYLVVYTNGTRVTHVHGTPPSLPFPSVWEFLNQRGDEFWLAQKVRSHERERQRRENMTARGKREARRPWLRKSTKG